MYGLSIRRLDDRQLSLRQARCKPLRRRDRRTDPRSGPALKVPHFSHSVAPKRGAVPLTGHVSTFAQKLAVGRVVRQVKGMRAIVEEIRIRSRGTISDDDIANRALNVLNGACFPSEAKLADVAR
jgi:hypothetical protein